jgi:hypothetical protein
MFAFNPGNEDRSGEILGSAAVGAAQTTADANVKLADDIGGSLVGLAGSLASGYMKKKEKESAVKSGDQMLGMFGDQLGITQDKLRQFDYDGMGLDDKYAFHQNLWGNLGAFSNLRMANQRYNLQQGAPMLSQNIKDANIRAQEGPDFNGTMLP